MRRKTLSHLDLSAMRRSTSGTCHLIDLVEDIWDSLQPMPHMTNEHSLEDEGNIRLR
jgi:hypothetical protein